MGDLSQNRRIHGFTLVEMAMIVAMLAFLIGAITVGREMIEQAQFRKVISNISKYDAALVAFETKYNELPGDFSHAEQMNLSEPGCPPYNTVNNCGNYLVPLAALPTLSHAGCNGNGDGTLGTPARVCPEALNFWYHLSRAGLIDGTYNPKIISRTRYHGMRGPIFGQSAPFVGMRDLGLALQSDYFLLGDRDIYTQYICDDTCDENGCNTNCWDNPIASRYQLSCEEAWRFDSKMDDGAVSTGRITAPGACREDGPPASYKLSNQTARTAIRIHLRQYGVRN